MSNAVDLSTQSLKSIARTDLPSCCGNFIKALAAEIVRERERAEAAQERLFRAMSDMEIKMAKARGPAAQPIQDGVKWQPPPNPTIGPDGFPQQGII